MSKLDELRKSAGANVADSFGAAGKPTGPAPSPASDPRWDGVTRDKDSLLIPIDRIVRDETQPRKEFDAGELRMLADSLKARGQLQPIRVRWDQGRGVYVVVVGERRWRAAAVAGLPRLACVFHADTGEDDRLEDQLVENALRSDLKPVEQAAAFRRLMDSRGYTVRRLAEILHVGHTTVVKALALLDLPEPVRESVDAGRLTPTSAYEIGQLDDPAEQVEVAAQAEHGRLTGAEIKSVVAAVKSRRPAPEPRPDPVTVEVEGWTVRATCRKASRLTAVQALAAAVKLLKGQGGERAA